MTKNINILLIGPISPPVTGCSVVNDLVLEKLNQEEGFRVDCINRAYPEFNEAIGEFSLKKVFFYVSQYIQAFKIFKCLCALAQQECRDVAACVYSCLATRGALPKWR